MRRAGAFALLVLLSGCGTKPDPSPETGSTEPPPNGYLLDDRGDAAPRFDIVRANLTEMNGSLVVWVEIKNFAEGLPLVEARLEASTGLQYVRIVPDPNRTQTPKVRAEGGRVDGESRTDAYEACWIPSFPTNAASPEPWWIFLELLHNRTGLSAGGRVESMSITTRDLNATQHDHANHVGPFQVEGRPNPYEASNPSCPLYYDRGRLF